MDWFQNKRSKKQAPVSAPAPKAADETEYKTVCGSRTECIQRLEDIFTLSSSKGVVLKLYLEDFKNLNKSFGYDYCEELLSQIISFLEEETGERVYRYIGVEFVLILEAFTEGKASDLADKILARFDNVWRIQGVDCLCSARIGICTYPSQADSVSELFKRLDLAVSAASERGMNQKAVYDSRLHNQFLRRQAIARYLHTALEKQELEVRYRPTYSLKERRFTRADSYMRIFIQGIGMVGDAEFVPIAEDSGQIRSIGYYALNHAGQCIAKLLEQGKEFESICIPVSPILLIQEDFLEKISKILETYQIPKGKLALEIDDASLVNNYLNVNVIMQELSDMGIELVMNNFGSGYAPVSSVLDLPINTVKLERMFIWQLEANPNTASVVGGLIQIANALDINIIAEGVETENQLKILNKYACEYQQGFCYAPTMEQDAMIQVMGATRDESRHIIEEEKRKMQR